MKKWFALFLAAVMIVGLLTGCSGREPEATEPETEPVETEATVPVTEPGVTEPEATDPVAEIITHGKMIRKLYKLANPSGSYEDFESAIAWAVKNGVVTDDAPFDPEAALTHLDMARFLNRYAKALDVIRDSDKLNDLKGWVWDEAEITEEADREAVAWAVGSGIMQLYQRQLLSDEAVTASEYRVIPARLSSLVKEVRAEQQAAVEATEPDETEPEETEETGSENQGSGSGSTGSSSGSGNSGGSSSGSSGNSGGSSSGGSGSSGSGNSGSSGSGSSGGSTVTEPTDPPEPPTYSKEEAMAAANNYLAGLGCTIDPSIAGGAYNFPRFWSREWLASNGGQSTLNQKAIDAAACDVDDIVTSVSGQEGIDCKPSDWNWYCYVADYTDYDGRVGYLIYIYYG